MAPRVGLVKAWGVRVPTPPCPLVPRLILETGVPILPPTGPNTRDPDLDDVNVQSSTLSRFGLISNRQRVDRFHSGMTRPPLLRDTELTCTQYALIFLPGLIVGWLRDPVTVTLSAPCLFSGQ